MVSVLYRFNKVETVALGKYPPNDKHCQGDVEDGVSGRMVRAVAAIELGVPRKHCGT